VATVLASSADKEGAFTELATLAELEKRHIFAALDRCKGNRTHAAKILDMSIRTLRNKLHEYNGTGAKSETMSEPEEQIS
jgi:DNA-binding NtrC family response regulator